MVEVVVLAAVPKFIDFLCLKKVVVDANDLLEEEDDERDSFCDDNGVGDDFKTRELLLVPPPPTRNLKAAVDVTE